MGAEMAADQLFAAIKFMHRERMIDKNEHDQLQQAIDRWAERNMVDESVVFGIECPKGVCDI